jgi:hypothetical protein
MTDWQPIETAPKDGTKILTCGLGHGNKIGSHEAFEKPSPMYGIAYWSWYDDTRDVEVSPGLFRKEPCRVLEMWRTEWSYVPTHWTALPEMPEVTDEAYSAAVHLAYSERRARHLLSPHRRPYHPPMNIAAARMTSATPTSRMGVLRSWFTSPVPSTRSVLWSSYT